MSATFLACPRPPQGDKPIGLKAAGVAVLLIIAGDLIVCEMLDRPSPSNDAAAEALTWVSSGSASGWR